ncbi:MAG: 16S rRNA (uracil(1498)-N(3))-methyltransferase [Clostridia bacterium]|nr:16S rRNA (uracil(1498)-N(3))-methyltransferase [Clostridia bacterium]
MPKFFVPPEQIYDDEILILGEDAQHITRSLRMRVGDQLLICNMNKRDYECHIASMDGKVVKAEIINSFPSVTEPEYKIIVYQCLPKSEKMDVIVQKSVELGATSIVPVISSRCIPQLDKKAREKRSERFNRIAYEAAKQCGRGIVPRVEECIDYATALENAQSDSITFICYENEHNQSLKGLLSVNKAISSVSFFVGPEGGFSREEIDLATEMGIPTVSLGTRILRTETASPFVLSAISLMREMK